MTSIDLVVEDKVEQGNGNVQIDQEINSLTPVMASNTTEALFLAERMPKELNWIASSIRYVEKVNGKENLGKAIRDNTLTQGQRTRIYARALPELTRQEYTSMVNWIIPSLQNNDTLEAIAFASDDSYLPLFIASRIADNEGKSALQGSKINQRKHYTAAARILDGAGFYRAAAVAYAKAGNASGIISVYAHCIIKDHNPVEAVSILNKYIGLVRKDPEAVSILATIVELMSEVPENNQYVSTLKSILSPLSQQVSTAAEPSASYTLNLSDGHKGSIGTIRKNALEVAHR